MVSSKKLPRGIRNNNPLNIRIGNTWLGEVPRPTDKAFEQFVQMEYGIRAGFVILRRYIRRYNRRTINDIVSAWAPSNENNTKAYIETVSRLTGIPADREIKYEDMATMVCLVDAMIQVECGQRVQESIIKKGYRIA